MRLATANILHKLPAHKASNALAIVLGQRPQIVALQEWGGSRSSILRNAGAFTRLPRLRMRRVTEGYSFAAPASGGPPVGVDASWGEIVSVRSLLLAPKRAADRATRGVEAIIQEHATGRVHAVLNIHLLAHHDDPAHLRGWNEGREACEKWARSWTGYDRWVLGDTNRHLMDLPPLHSCWERHPAEPTFGKRTIDTIYGNERADAVRAFRTGSDHRAVVADYS
jgi:hypothetical protein